MRRGRARVRAAQRGVAQGGQRSVAPCVCVCVVSSRGPFSASTGVVCSVLRLRVVWRIAELHGAAPGAAGSAHNPVNLLSPPHHHQDKKPVNVSTLQAITDEVKFIEFIGTVQADGSLIEASRCTLTDNFDMVRAGARRRAGCVLCTRGGLLAGCLAHLSLPSPSATIQDAYAEALGLANGSFVKAFY